MIYIYSRDKPLLSTSKLPNLEKESERTNESERREKWVEAIRRSIESFQDGPSLLVTVTLTNMLNGETASSAGVIAREEKWPVTRRRVK